jgi:hypothetical protein
MTDDMKIPYSAAPAGGFLTVGQGADCDAAFDDATENAWYELGRAQLVPSVTGVNPEQLTVLDTDPLPLWAAVQRARAALGELPAGSVVAVPVGKRGSYTRRKVAVVVEDPTIEFPATPQPLHDLHVDALRALAGATAEELLDTVELRRPARAKYKVVTTRHDGPKQNRFSVYLPGQAEPLSSHPTAGDARRAAVAYAKSSTGTLTATVRKETFVNGTDPLFTVTRDRVAQKAAVRVELCTPKPNVKTVAWVFAGCPVLSSEKSAQ